MVSWSYGFLQSLAWGAGSGIGWFVAVVALAGLRQKIRFSKVPPALEGAGITIVVAGTMAMAFMGFAGMVAIR